MSIHMWLLTDDTSAAAIIAHGYLHSYSQPMIIIVLVNFRDHLILVPLQLQYFQ